MPNKYLNDTGLTYFFNRLKTLFLTNVAYDSTNKKITKTLNGTTSDVVTLATLKSGMSLTKSDVGLGNVDNTADASKSVASASTLTTARYIEGAKFDGSANAINFTSCTTAAATAAKTPTAITGFSVASGSRVVIQFTKGLTSGSGTTAITLNVSSTGAKDIKYLGANVTTGSTAFSSQNIIVEFICDGTCWHIVGLYTTASALGSISSSGGTTTISYNGTDYKVAEIESPTFTGTPKAPTAAAGTNTTQIATTAFVTSAVSGKADKASPTFTGTPKAPTAAAGTNTTQIATTAFVKTAVDNAVGGITQITYEVVTSLPQTGTNGKIYLVAHSHGTSDAYDEYIWTGSAFEKLGNTDVDLSGYLKTTDMVAITTSEIDALFA